MTPAQQRLIDTAADAVPPGSREAFTKFIEDFLRPKLEPRDTDVFEATREAVLRYAVQPTQH